LLQRIAILQTCRERFVAGYRICDLLDFNLFVRLQNHGLACKPQTIKPTTSASPGSARQHFLSTLSPLPFALNFVVTAGNTPRHMAFFIVVIYQRANCWPQAAFARDISDEEFFSCRDHPHRRIWPIWRWKA
jgi:hypothetical protein